MGSRGRELQRARRHGAAHRCTPMPGTSIKKTDETPTFDGLWRFSDMSAATWHSRKTRRARATRSCAMRRSDPDARANRRDATQVQSPAHVRQQTLCRSLPTTGARTRCIWRWARSRWLSATAPRHDRTSDTTEGERQPRCLA